MNPQLDILQNKTLLVVDDDPQNRELVLEIVLDHLPELDLLLAKDGQQALEIIAKKTIDLILLDWEMPKLNGLGVLEALGKHNQWAEIPVIMYTGAMTESNHLAQALNKGAWDFLRKPADPIELIARIHNIFKQKHLEQARKKAEQTTLEQKIQHLQQELRNNVLNLARKNQNLNEILQKLQDPKPNLNQVCRHIQQQIEQDDYWSQWLEQFNQTDPDFSPQLLQQFPELSKAELRLALLLRLNMDNKTIAQLLNISSEGIKKARYRLRKKLQLEDEINLDHFIVQFGKT